MTALLMPCLETLDGLDPLRPAHTCPRCRELWVYREVAVQWGLIVRVLCPNGHAGSVYLPDLPDRITERV